MKLINVLIHNIRSIKDVELNVNDYSLIVGENNVGKTNILYSLRLFYEENVKFNPSTDFIQKVYIVLIMTLNLFWELLPHLVQI